MRALTRHFSCLLLIFLTASPTFAQDTFSIVAVDTETGEVGSAGASCIDASQFGGVKLLSGIIPGRGGINAQATVCLPVHFNLVNGLDQMAQGKSPAEIIQWLVDNDACNFGNFTTRQYGIVDFDGSGNPRSAAYTGINCTVYANHATGFNYAVQGNILLGQQIIDSMEARFLNTPGSLAKKLMAALQGANVPGADTRCLNQGTSSRSAFLRIAKPDNHPDSLFLELNVPVTPIGVEPIDSLQKLFDAWMTTSTNEITGSEVPAKVFPNPSGGVLWVDWLAGGVGKATASVVDITGKEILKQPLTKGKQCLRLPDTVGRQVLIVLVRDEQGSLVFSEKIVVER
jgi:uncharacterized Ntn-hydrolase superfamily protein